MNTGCVWMLALNAVSITFGRELARRTQPDSDAVRRLMVTILGKLEGKRRAPVTLCVADGEGREIDIALPQPYPVTPQIKGALKAVQGVVLVEEI